MVLDIAGQRAGNIRINLEIYIIQTGFIAFKQTKWISVNLITSTHLILYDICDTMDPDELSSDSGFYSGPDSDHRTVSREPLIIESRSLIIIYYSNTH